MFERPNIEAPTVDFFCILSGLRPPKPASDTVNGFLPGRAKSFCPPVTMASGFGYWLYPPYSFALKWDGLHSSWAFIDDDGELTTDWKSLGGGVDIVSDKQRAFVDRVADLRGADVAALTVPNGIPWLNADPRAQHLIELDFGVIARTSPGWSLLIRSVPNWPQRGVQLLDGIMETDWYRSTLGTILRIDEAGEHRIFQHLPIACAQPVPSVAFNPTTMTRFTVENDPDVFIGGDEFDEFVGTRVGRVHAASSPSGNYRTMARHAAAGRCPWHGHPDIADLPMPVIDPDE
jgi:hypothetical protein